MRQIVFLMILTIGFLLAAYFSVSSFFCSGSLGGDFAGCFAMTGADMFRSTTAQIAALIFGAGSLYLFQAALRR